MKLFILIVIIPSIFGGTIDNESISGSSTDREAIIKLNEGMALLASGVEQNALDRMALVSFVLRNADLYYAPQAIIYREKNSDGNVFVEEFNMEEPFKPNPPCLDLAPNKSRVESINVVTGCVRFFKDMACSGENFLATGFNKITHEDMFEIKSIGACE